MLHLAEGVILRYKFKVKSKIKTIDGKYESQASIRAILDGESYAVQVRDGDKKNSLNMTILSNIINIILKLMNCNLL